MGEVDNSAFQIDRDEILQKGLKTLDTNGRIAMEMKLHLGKYSERETSEVNNKQIWKWKYNNSMKDIAEELEVPVATANKIYKEAFKKLSKYCQAVSEE